MRSVREAFSAQCFLLPDFPRTLKIPHMISRRRFMLISATLPFLACNKEYDRPSKTVELGFVKDLLQPVQILRDKGMLVFFSDRGWRTMSTRCTYDGCELSIQDRALLCTCCKSIFTLAGNVLRGPAVKDLPYYSLNYKEEKLFAEVGDEISATEHFLDPALIDVLESVRDQLKSNKARYGESIPEALMGKSDSTAELMFQEIPDAENVVSSPTPTPKPIDIDKGLIERLKGKE
jgi:nitrite reductase/ring-hydroxylating ferredoxin subunit